MIPTPEQTSWKRMQEDYKRQRTTAPHAKYYIHYIT